MSPSPSSVPPRSRTDGKSDGPIAARSLLSSVPQEDDMAWKACSVCALIVSVSAAQVWAQTPAQFYAGKTVTLVVGSTPGGYYDIGGRIVARYFGQYIPGNP